MTEKGKNDQFRAPISEPSRGASGKTGVWRVTKPVIDKEKCINCLICWMYCPEGCIDIREEDVEVDLDYCKGCGICSEECPVDAIKTVEE